MPSCSLWQQQDDSLVTTAAGAQGCWVSPILPSHGTINSTGTVPSLVQKGVQQVQQLGHLHTMLGHVMQPLSW